VARPLKKFQGLYEKVAGSGIWYIRYRVKGKLVRKMIGDRDEAIEALRKVTTIRTSGMGVLATSAKELTLTVEEESTAEVGKITVGQLCDEYLAHIQNLNNPRRPSDQVNPPQRIGAIKKAFGHRAADLLKAFQIEDWLMSLGKKPATLNRYKTTFSSVYQYARNRGKVTANPVRDIKQFPVELLNPRWLQPEEETRLREVLDRWISDCPEHHALTKLYLRCHPHELTVALGTGMRKGNQYSLRWEYVDFDNRAINLPKTKNGAPLTIPMIDDVHNALTELRSIQVEVEALQAESERHPGKAPQRMVAGGRVFNISENREWWNAALEEAKVFDFRWHDTRHTFASRLAMAKVPLKSIQEACGHKSMAMTLRYAHLNQAVLHDAMSVLNRTPASSRNSPQ
jgi:integrase